MLARQIAIGFGIVVVFPLLVYYAVATFRSPPQFNFAVAALAPNATPEQRQEALAARQEAQKAYAQDERSFTLTLFWVAVPLGIAAICAGGWGEPHPVGTGFLLGGILTVGQGCYFHWAYLDNPVRCLSLIFALLALLVVGFRRVAPASGASATP